ncbi:MAG: DUF116 domain-containing protein [Clostridia bacterium]|nr:DUF116 domain-containing protein [Clostridia bacterium]
MEVITYSLRDNQRNSDQYYSDAETFTDEVLFEAEGLVRPLVQEFQAHIRETGKESPRTYEEHMLEFLMLGTLWRIYSSDASGMPDLPGQILTRLAELRQDGGCMKPGIDFLRGVLSTLFLSPDTQDNLCSLLPTMEHFKLLINWLEATGDFNQEVKRLNIWKDFLTSVECKKAGDSLATAITFASWFEMRSEEVLGKYTPNVEKFLRETHPKHLWHEDAIFCGRRRVEYHLNMLGAEIMNRAFRQAFLEAKRKYVLVPGCMRLMGESSCRAHEAELGLVCTGCNQACSINKLTCIAKKYGIKVRLVSHESSISPKESPELASGDRVGIVGVACVTNLIGGGLKLKSFGIPAQCVLLDYCGCNNHWHKDGIPTDINLNQLFKILGIDKKALV